MGKYLELFRGEVGDLTEKTKLENKPYVAYSTKEDKVTYTVVSVPVKVQPNNEIWYTTSDGRILEFNDYYCNAKLVSNTYENGKGIAVFDQDITGLYDGKITVYDDGSHIYFGFLSDSYTWTGYYTPFTATISLPESIKRVGHITLAFGLRNDADQAVIINPFTEITLGKNIEYIGSNKFELDKVYYSGTLESWNSIEFGSDYMYENSYLKVSGSNPAEGAEFYIGGVLQS